MKQKHQKPEIRPVTSNGSVLQAIKRFVSRVEDLCACSGMPNLNLKEDENHKNCLPFEEIGYHQDDSLTVAIIRMIRVLL